MCWRDHWSVLEDPLPGCLVWWETPQGPHVGIVDATGSKVYHAVQDVGVVCTPLELIQSGRPQYRALA